MIEERELRDMRRWQRTGGLTNQRGAIDRLLDSYEAALRVVEAAKVFVDRNSVVHPQFIKSLREALAPFTDSGHGPEEKE